jgi:hypothetical protein
MYISTLIFNPSEVRAPVPPTDLDNVFEFGMFYGNLIKSTFREVYWTNLQCLPKQPGIWTLPVLLSSTSRGDMLTSFALPQISGSGPSSGSFESSDAEL